MARVLVVDDLAHVRVVVRTALRVRGHIEIVGEATTTFSAVDADPTWYRNHGAAGFIDKSTGITELVDAVERAGSAA
jgi:DNA-binding NarL/FixJ family response regulator